MTLQSHSWAYTRENMLQKDTSNPMFMAAIAKTWKQPKCPMRRCGMCAYIHTYIHIYIYIYTHTYTHTHTHTHIHNRILFSYQNNEIMPFAATWIDLEIIILSEVSQTKTNVI